MECKASHLAEGLVKGPPPNENEFCKRVNLVRINYGDSAFTNPIGLW